MRKEILSMMVVQRTVYNDMFDSKWRLACTAHRLILTHKQMYMSKESMTDTQAMQSSLFITIPSAARGSITYVWLYGMQLIICLAVPMLLHLLLDIEIGYCFEISVRNFDFIINSIIDSFFSAHVSLFIARDSYMTRHPAKFDAFSMAYSVI